MSNKKLLEKLAVLNENVNNKREEKNNKFEYLRQVDFYENGIQDSLEQVYQFAESVMSDKDLKNINSVEDFFKVFIERSNQSIKKAYELSKEIVNLQMKRRETIENILENSEVNDNLNFVCIDKFKKPHKAIKALNELQSEFPEKFQFDTFQILSFDGKQNNVNFLLHGDLEELNKIIKTTDNASIKSLKHITGEKFNEFFEPHFEKNVIFEKNKVINLLEIDTEEFNEIYQNKKTRKNKMS